MESNMRVVVRSGGYLVIKYKRIPSSSASLYEKIHPFGPGKQRQPTRRRPQTKNPPVRRPAGFYVG
jgi:hypothetical protein